MNRPNVHRRRIQGAFAALIWAAGVSAIGAVDYRSGDLMFVAYQPQGREYIVDLGPAAAFAGAKGPVTLLALDPADLSRAFGQQVDGLRVALFAAVGPDSIVSTVGPDGSSGIGSVIGASSQIHALGANATALGRLAEGNPHAVVFEYGDPGSYQSTLDASNQGSLGNNVPFDAETALGAVALRVPSYRFQFNPFTGHPASQKLLGTFVLEPQGRLTFKPAGRTEIQAAGSAATPSGARKGRGGSS